MTKNQKIVLVVLILILIVGGIRYFSLLQKAKLPPTIKVPEEEKVSEEIFSLSAVVVSVNPENNFLIVKPAKEEKQIKVILSQDSRLTKLEFPFDPKNPPKEATFTPKKVDIKISDIKAGDNVFIKSLENIAGKTEFGDVDFIQVLP